MGSLVGHVAPGFGFFVIGLWHLFNHIKLHFLHRPASPYSYSSLPWFPIPKSRYLELYIIIFGSSASVAMELFISPRHHQPLDITDWTIPSNHLHNLEHSSISMSFIVYGVFAILFDKTKPKLHLELTQLLAALAFGQELFLFHLHSTDHAGVEGQYHSLLQILIFVSLLTTLMGISQPESFLISFVRSVSIMLQGAWLMIMGVMLWTPSFIPKGCFMSLDEGHFVVRCGDNLSLSRAKALANNEFSWLLIGSAVFVMCFFLGIARVVYGDQKNDLLIWTSIISHDNKDDIDELQHDFEEEVSSSFSGSSSVLDLESQKPCLT